MTDPIDILGVAAARLYAAKCNWHAVMCMQFSRNAENAAQLAHAEMTIAGRDVDTAQRVAAEIAEAQNAEGV